MEDMSTLTQAQVLAALEMAGLNPVTPPGTLTEAVTARLKTIDNIRPAIPFPVDSTAFVAALRREAS